MARCDVFLALGPGHPIPKPHDARIFIPHTTTRVSIVKDANNNALSTEANFITLPSASYPASTLSDSIIRRQPAWRCSRCGHWRRRRRTGTNAAPGFDPEAASTIAIVAIELSRLVVEGGRPLALAARVGVAVHDGPTAGAQLCALAVHAGGNPRDVGNFA